MKPVFVFLFSQSIILPLAVGLLRYPTVRKGYGFFFWTIVLGFLTEIISFILIHYYHASNAPPTNIFVLAEWILLSLQFHRWGLLKKSPRLFFSLLGFGVLVWGAENLVFGQISNFSPYFRIVYGFILTLMSITEINYRITHQSKRLFSNPELVLCIGIMLFFIYQMLYEWCYQVSLVNGPSGFTQTITALFAYFNALVNIIYALGLLAIPAYRQYRINQTLAEEPPH